MDEGLTSDLTWRIEDPSGGRCTARARKGENSNKGPRNSNYSKQREITSFAWGNILSQDRLCGTFGRPKNERAL